MRSTTRHRWTAFHEAWAPRADMPDGPAKTSPWSHHLVTALLGTVIVVGLFLDGWAHLNLETKLAPFLEPWHAVMYAGFVASGAWIMTRNQRRFRFQPSQLPRGYGLAVVGMAIAGVGVVGDALWHVIFGVETGVARVLSTFHVLPFAGTVLVLMTPLRALWLDSSVGRLVSYARLLPALLALSFTTAFVAYYLQYLSPFVNWSVTNVVQQSPPVSAGADELGLIARVGSILVTNLLLLAPVLVLVRRWTPPPGSATTVFGVVTIMSSALNEFALGSLVAAGLAGGVTADLLLWRARTRSKIPQVRVIAATVPVATWGAYFVALASAYGAVWPPELWMGTIVVTSLIGLALSWLMFTSAPAASSVGPTESAGSIFTEPIYLAPLEEPTRITLGSAEPGKSRRPAVVDRG
ncbi:MAG: hypothetical protein M3198_02175 [Actinomycetota bacterium]|nr:hypothetical protein [Actinomycetota bacterium]